MLAVIRHQIIQCKTILVSNIVINVFRMMIDPIHYIIHHTLVSFQETTHDILIIIQMYQNLRPTEDWILRNLFRREEYLDSQ